MHNPYRHIIQNQTLWLHPERCIYWEEAKTLLLADLHLGKSGHFRKAGIGIPQSAFKEDMQRLTSLLQHYQPQQLIVVGDLFHSHNNKEHDFFVRWRQAFAQLTITLVPGNHDILEMVFYTTAGLQVSPIVLEQSPFCFVHDVATTPPPANQYAFSGHIHPGVRISGGGRQHVRLPCFYFGKTYAVLPAFGNFTGLHIVTPKKGETAFAIAGKTIVPVGV